jgi:type IV pilus assembly protein PilP
VEESSGKGYMIGVGTYIGLNGGKVVAIYKDRFVVEEEIEDALGNIKTERREIKLPKPSGDLS